MALERGDRYKLCGGEVRNLMVKILRASGNRTRPMRGKTLTDEMVSVDVQYRKWFVFTMFRSSKVLLVVAAAGSLAFATAATENQQLPAGISDLLAATPTMLSPLSTTTAQRNDKASDLRSNNTITITGSQIVFARSDKQTLIATIESMIENSEASERGDVELTGMIMAVLEADGSKEETEIKTQIQKTLTCRAHKETIHKCVTELVDVATRGDDAA